MPRPEKPIDWDKVDKLLMAGCKGTEIAPHFNMHVNTFYDKVKDHYNICFTEYSLIKKQEGDSLLRKAQFDKALKEDNTMLIWLGKQRLEQRDSYSEVDSQTMSDLLAFAAAMKATRNEALQDKSSSHTESQDAVAPLPAIDAEC